ncbi:MAG: hypothetical protein ACRD3C_22360 [Vicinamibacterales bacterium]
MRARIAWVTLVLCVLPVAAAAQDGLRSASLPERGPGLTALAERDLFLVPPDFYNRRPDPSASRLLFPQVLPTYVGTPYWYVSAPADVAVRPAARQPFREVMPEPAAVPSVTLPPLPPGQPKTFYVIPGCYAGDKPPEPEWLPAGCDASNMRVVPPA